MSPILSACNRLVFKDLKINSNSYLTFARNQHPSQQTILFSVTLSSSQSPLASVSCFHLILNLHSSSSMLFLFHVARSVSFLTSCRSLTLETMCFKCRVLIVARVRNEDVLCSGSFVSGFIWDCSQYCLLKYMHFPKIAC